MYVQADGAAKCTTANKTNDERWKTSKEGSATRPELIFKMICPTSIHMDLNTRTTYTEK